MCVQWPRLISYSIVVSRWEKQCSSVNIGTFISLTYFIMSYVFKIPYPKVKINISDIQSVEKSTNLQQPF